MKRLELVPPREIENRSFEIIGEELQQRGITIPAEQESVTKRVIHTSADFEYAQTMCYSENAIAIARNLIRQGAESIKKCWQNLVGKCIALWQMKMWRQKQKHAR